MILAFDPQLAIALKHEGSKFSERSALVLRQIEFWLATPNSGIELDGVRWIWNSISKWAEQFPWLSSWQIRATLDELEEMGLVRSSHFQGKRATNRAKLYAICEERLKALRLSICGHTTNPFEDRPQMDLRSVLKSNIDNNQYPLSEKEILVCVSRGDEEKDGQKIPESLSGQGKAESQGSFSPEENPSLGGGQYSAASSPLNDELIKREDVAQRLRSLDIAPEVAIASVPEKVKLLGVEAAARVLIQSLDAIAQNPRAECPPAMLRAALREGGWQPRQAAQNQPKVESPARSAHPWESEPGKPLEVFLQWCAAQLDKVPTERRRSAAYSWISKDAAKTQPLFEDFLRSCDRVADAQLAVQAGGGTPLLPSWFAVQEAPSPEKVMGRLAQLGAVPALEQANHPAAAGATCSSYLSEAVCSQVEKGNELESARSQAEEGNESPISLSDRVTSILSMGRLAVTVARSFLRSLSEEMRAEAISLFSADKRGAQILAAVSPEAIAQPAEQRNEQRDKQAFAEEQKRLAKAWLEREDA